MLSQIHYFFNLRGGTFVTDSQSSKLHLVLVSASGSQCSLLRDHILCLSSKFKWNSLTQANLELPGVHAAVVYERPCLLKTLWLVGTVRAEPETVISRAWVQSPDPAE